VSALRAVRACDTPSCDAEGTCEITDHGVHVAWHCSGCIEIIEGILENTSRMVKLGTPRAIAADWAGGAANRRHERA
jgi:hypothetical protein